MLPAMPEPTPEHTPRRPGWTCRDCGEAWPCRTRQTMLREEFRDQPVAVVLYLAGCYEEASGHLTDLPSDVVYSRMFGWLGGRGVR
jgi:hypothetical protein